jgi:hypothetical protein
MTTEERDTLLLRLESTVTRLDSTVTRLEAGQDELRVYVKAITRKLLAPVEIAEIETEVVNANAIAAD